MSLDLRDHGASFWEELQHAEVYISKELQAKWAELQQEEELPPCDQASVASCFRLQIGNTLSRQGDLLFTGRGAVLQEDNPPCFYCAMTNHEPGDCPSKKISMASRNIDRIGYIPFSELNDIYPKIFNNFTPLMKKLIHGVKEQEIRHDPQLLVLTAYLDIYLIFQFRFLWFLSFSSHANWADANYNEELVPDNNNLQLGLDSLRAGEYETAIKLLTLESKQVSSSKAFYAHIGLAFLAMENSNNKEAIRCLERARERARQEKEHIYVLLLLSRFYELEGTDWKVREVISELKCITFDPLAIQYRILQMAVWLGQSAKKLKRELTSIMIGNKEMLYFTLLDPVLLPIQGYINDLASKEYGQVRKIAAKNMIQAKADYAKLQPWFPPRDPFLVSQTKALNVLAKQLQKQSYYELLEVADRCIAIISSCNRILEERKKNFSQALANYAKITTECHQVWQEFNHKRFFKSFQGELLEVEDDIKLINALLAKETSESYCRATTVMDELDGKIVALRRRQNMMITMGGWAKGLTTFTKRLTITEGLIILISLVVYFSLPALQQGSMGGLANSPANLKNILLFAIFFLAPATAAGWTLYSSVQAGLIIPSAKK